MRYHAPGNASVDGSVQFMQTSNCHPWLMAIVDVKAAGLIQAGVINTVDQPVTIQSGQQYGQVTLTCDVNEAQSFQARLPTIHPWSSPTSTPTTLTDATLRVLSVHSLSGNLPTCHQRAPQSHDRPRNNLRRHLAMTQEEPESPFGQGEPPTHMESGAPPIGKMGSSHHQGAGPTLNMSGAPSMILLRQTGEAPPNQSELGAPSASQLARPQGVPPDPEEIGGSSQCQRLA
jgi:hypothetical protein